MDEDKSREFFACQKDHHCLEYLKYFQPEKAKQGGESHEDLHGLPQ
jgi:hypothetical protein